MIEKVLVIGGNGFLGKSLINTFTNNPLSNHEFYQGFFSNQGHLSNSVHINILDPLSVDSAVQNFDVIINCSGQITNPIEICYNQNTKGVQLLSKAVNKYNRYLIHLSSAVVYGSADNPDELSPLNFETPYAACKSFAEYVISNEVDENKYLTLRIANLYGGNQKKGLFAYLKRSFSSDRILEFNNDGNQKKSFIHLDDCIAGLIILLKNRAYGTYNLPVSNICTIKEIIERVEIYTGVRFHSFFEELGRLEILTGLNSDKFFTQTGYINRHTIDTYIKSTFLNDN
jgi:nucleoside-diphosphate-sugar epimerase